MASYPNINGMEYSSASIEVRAVGRKWFPQSISLGESLEPGIVRKVGSSQPAGHTRGEWTGDDGTMEMTVAEGMNFIEALGDGFGTVVFSIQVVYAEDNMPTTSIEAPAARISKPAVPSATGTDAAKITFSFKLLKPLKWGTNGRQIVNDLPTL